MNRRIFTLDLFSIIIFDNIPIKKTSNESNVVTAVCYVTSDAVFMITGTSIILDGVWTAR